MTGTILVGVRNRVVDALAGRQPLDESPEQELIRRNAWALGILFIALGAVIIGCHLESGGERWSAPAWKGALLVPGAPATWGVIIALAGALLLAGARGDGRPAIHRAGALTAFWWFVGIAAWQTVTLCHDDTGRANPIFVPVWVYLAWICMARVRLSQLQNGPSWTVATLCQKMRRT